MAFYGSDNNRKMPFTREQIADVYRTDIVTFLQQQGFELTKKDSKAMTLKGYGGLVFFHDSCNYYWHSKEEKGNIIDFVKDWYGMDFISAVELILGTRAYRHSNYDFSPLPKAEKKELILPPRDETMVQVYAYLCKTRGLETSIVSAMIADNKIYQSKTVKDGKTYRNCAFVGYDMNDSPKHCALRSTNSNVKFHRDVTGSDKSYCFSMEGRSNRAFIFEAAIDALSHASLCHLHGMDWTLDHRVIEGGLTNKSLTRYLKDHPEVEELTFCYDNDGENLTPEGLPWNQGQEQAIKTAKLFEKEGYACQIQTPRGKDFNVDLLQFHEMAERIAQQENQYEEEGDFER